MPTIYRSSTPPAGWTLQAGRITLTPPADEPQATKLAGSYQALLAWANANRYKLTPYDYVNVLWNEYAQLYVWGVFQLDRSSTVAAATTHNNGLLASSTCTTQGCNATIGAGVVLCSRDHYQLCDNCGLAGLRTQVLTGFPGRSYCAACVRECSTRTCHNLVLSTDTNTKCTTCDPRMACSYCSTVHPTSAITEFGDSDNKTHHLCPTCINSACEECRRFGRPCSSVSYDGVTRRLCEVCASAVYDKKRESMERWPTDEIPISGSLIVPASANRPIRTISIETEFDGNGTAVGRALHKAGLIEGAAIGNYSTQGNNAHRFPCILKRDGSVTGGELVTYLMQMDDESHAAAVLRMTEVMRGCREVGFAQFTHRAGGHIHQDLHGFDMQDLWVYYTLFKFLEMPIYYLAGAGASYGHRSLSGSSYCNPPARGPFGDVKEFAARREAGRTGFNIGNFIHSVTTCQCGAYAAGKMKECNCNLGKATVEWRVFNAEINPRILHAWIALIQSLAAYAQDMEGFKEADFPYLNWAKVPFSKLPGTSKSQIKTRLEWIFRYLPLTLHERDSLIYAMKKSQLVDLGETYLNGLINVEPKQLITKKAPANPNRRKKSLQIKAQKVAAGAGTAFFVDDDGYFEDDEDDF